MRIRIRIRIGFDLAESCTMDAVVSVSFPRLFIHFFNIKLFLLYLRAFLVSQNRPTHDGHLLLVCVTSATVTVEQQLTETSVSQSLKGRKDDGSLSWLHSWPGKTGWDGAVVTQCNHTELIGRIPCPVRTPPLSLLHGHYNVCLQPTSDVNSITCTGSVHLFILIMSSPS